MKFALEIEGKVAEFYKEVSDYAKDASLVELLGNLVSRGEKRVKTLERVRRENVTEMILEQIEGLDSEPFEIDTSISKGVDDGTIKTSISTVENTLLKFYTDAARKLDFLPEAEYAFELLAEKNEETIKRLAS